jgi:uncharacterized membrane protein YjfL (UPF0719 family)
MNSRHSALALALLFTPSIAAAADQAGAREGLLGSLLGLGVSVIQVAVGLAIASFSIITGFKILGKLLARNSKEFDVWPALKAGNVAVALLAAGIVISYTNVVSTGIKSMSDTIGKLLQGDVTLGKGIAGFCGAGFNLFIALAVASFAITVVFKIMDKLTKDIDERAEFDRGNTAIGVLYAGIIIGVSQLVSSAVNGIGTGIANMINSVLA